MKIKGNIGMQFGPPKSDTAMFRALNTGVLDPEMDQVLLGNELRDLSPRERKFRLRQLRRERARLDKKLGGYDQKLEYLNGLLAAYNDLDEWAKGILCFERPNGTSFHHLREAAKEGKVLDLCRVKEERIDGGVDLERELFADAEAFVVEHNWAEAFKRAEDFGGGSFRLPYDICIFEFRIGGRRVIALAVNYPELNGSETDNQILIQPMVLTPPGWAALAIYWYRGGTWDVEKPGYVAADDSFYPLAVLLGTQIKAVCVALDAEVAHTEVVRVSEALAHARERAGRAAPSDYHVVSLSRRARADPMPSFSDEPKRRMRLHFRRGHWRHFPTHKTWIKWMLVGDPDLGFIDKHYRL